MPPADDVQLPSALPASTQDASSREANLLGFTSVFLNGQTQEIGTEETNLGSLVADANLRLAQSVEPATAASITSASAFRGSIGYTDSFGYRREPGGNRHTGKPFGIVSQLSIETALAPNRGLSLVTVSAARLLELLEHGVAAYAVNSPSARFPQVSGLGFSFDPSRRAQVLDAAGTVTIPGERVRNVALTNADGSAREMLVRNGQVLGDPDRIVRLVVPDALAEGGDGYRFDLFGSGRVDLEGNPAL